MSIAKAAYRDRCQTMRGRADVYVGFFERSLAALSLNGRQVFICADRWMHNEYGKALRAFVIESFAVDSVLKLHGVDAFEGDVDAYPAITVIRRGPQGKVTVGDASPSFGAADACEYLAFMSSEHTSLSTSAVTAARLPSWHTTDDLWPQGSAELITWLSDIQRRHPSLESSDGRTELRIGVATGRDEVYIVGPGKVPKVEQDRLLPLACPEDVKSGHFNWAGRYLINPWRDDGGGLVDLAKFPRTARYLRKHKAVLSARSCVRKIKDRTKQASSWYKTIDRVHHDRLTKPYLALEDMKAYAHPVLVPAGYYPAHGLYAIRSDEWDLEVLGGLLISGVFERQVAAYCVRMRGDTLRFQAQYLRMCRIPAPASISAGIAKELAAAFKARDRQRATAAALRAYKIEKVAP